MGDLIARALSKRNADEIGDIQRKFSSKHLVNDYQIPGETTVLYRIQGNGEVPYTLLEVAAPESSNGVQNEATLTLMREVDSETSAPEFLDIYNNGYDDSRQMGIRIQSRGSGVLRDFVFDFNNGQGVTETMRVTKEELRLKRGMSLQKDGNKLFLLKSADGTVQGHIGRLADRTTMYNAVTETAFEMFDNGSTTFYSPSGDLYIYLDSGDVYVNDLPITVIHSGPSSGRPAGKQVGYSYFDTTLGKPIWWKGSVWVDATGTMV